MGVGTVAGAEVLGISNAADVFTSSLGLPVVGRLTADSLAFIAGWSTGKMKNILARRHATQPIGHFDYDEANEKKPLASEFGKYFNN